MRGILIGQLVAALLVAAAPAAQGSPATVVHRIAIVDDAFDPEGLELAGEDQVTWVNEGTRDHTVTADDGSFDSGALAPGDTFRVQDPPQGTVRYHCSIHGGPGGEGMSGVLFVAVAGPATAAGDAEQPDAPSRAGLARTGSADVPAGALAFLALTIVALGVYLACYEQLAFPERR